MSVCVVLIFFMKVVFCQPENLKFRLTQSTSSLEFWTAAPTTKVFKEDYVPTETGSSIKIYCAQNEFEPFQIVVRPSTSQSVTVTLPTFSNEKITVELYQVQYVYVSQPTDFLSHEGEWPDPLYPLENEDSVDIIINENTAFWVLINVPYEGVSSGDYSGEIVIGGVKIPVNLHVFNFKLPLNPSVKSSMNFDYGVLMERYGITAHEMDTATGNYWEFVNATRLFWLNHRLATYNSLFPSSVAHLDYNCEEKQWYDKYKVDWDWEEYGFEHQSKISLIDGMDGGKTFAACMAIGGGANGETDSRPDEICGVQRSSDDFLSMSSTDYNEQYFEYLKGMQDYFDSFNLLDKIYFFPIDEPNTEASYDGVAWMSAMVNEHAPKLDFFVTEPPSEGLYDHPDFNSKIDIWCPVLYQFDPYGTVQRQEHCQESIWMYFLMGDIPPMIAPITLDHPGIESKLAGWVAYRYRVDGILYYNFNGAWRNGNNPWTDPYLVIRNGEHFMLYPPDKNNDNIEYFSNKNRFVPSIRMELMRDGLEDYEYLAAFNNAKPDILDQRTEADHYVRQVVMGIYAYNKDENFLYNLRKNIGLYVGGEIDSIPELFQTVPHERCNNVGDSRNYFLNFQRIEGDPTDDPLIVDNIEWMKIEGNQYDSDTGYGFFSPFIVYGNYLYENEHEDDSLTVLDRSWVYNGMVSETFYFALPNGGYTIELRSGCAGHEFPKTKIYVQGIPFINVENNEKGYITRKKDVYVSNYMLAVELGGYPSNGDAYSPLNWMKIEFNGKSKEEIDMSIYTDKPEKCSGRNDDDVNSKGNYIRIMEFIVIICVLVFV